MNRLPALIVKVERSESLCFLELDASGIALSMLLFDLKPEFSEGSRVQVLFKETEVVLAKQLSGEISFSNRFQAIVTKISKGIILADISLSCPAGEFSCIVTLKAVNRLALEPGDEVTVMVKASQLSLEAGHDA
ncbi:TOBE domain protein [Chlorobium limicola DSM 245]|uniref:TOBE domain protein n=1 Tax=Chlorobium limicola (strain DSM 245 / NBRC 103803 / 6330) TaxID=290315 RepID=B3EFI3_CHLL2|nr:TOBE domain-containing protein [Chlorobium limicola]ACD89466.1 TOBE domain protein [Chlorobium limicola DSM 245]